MMDKTDLGMHIMNVYACRNVSAEHPPNLVRESVIRIYCKYDGNNIKVGVRIINVYACRDVALGLVCP